MERGAVSIRTLGTFQVLRDGHPVPLREWQSKKARDLLKILVARRGRPATREFLMECLWPQEDPGPLSNRLNVALHVLRTVLDPARRMHLDHYVVGDRVVVRLNLRHVSVDVEEFLADAETGLGLLRADRVPESVPTLGSAEERYAGDFLEEDLYEEWAVQIRERARVVYIAVVRGLARSAAEAGDPDQAVQYWLRVLDCDPFDEQAHLDMIRTLDRAGRHGAARRSHAVYARRMGEIDVPVAPYPSPLSARLRVAT
jgi:DNA-binding SARP family transcriptional activator